MPTALTHATFSTYLTAAEAAGTITQRASTAGAKHYWTANTTITVTLPAVTGAKMVINPRQTFFNPDGVECVWIWANDGQVLGVPVTIVAV
jgi:hypothetical protein